MRVHVTATPRCCRKGMTQVLFEKPQTSNPMMRNNIVRRLRMKSPTDATGENPNG